MGEQPEMISMQRYRAATAAELAGLLRALVRFGVAARLLGWCRGDLRLGELSLSVGGLDRATPGRGLCRQMQMRQQLHRRRTHQARGHDAGCAAFGLPFSLVTRALSAWDSRDAQALVEEAFVASVWDVIGAQLCGDPWTVTLAQEALDFALEQRLTPVPPCLAARR